MNSKLLRICSLSVDVGDTNAPIRLLDKVSLDIESGEVLALVGESGSGKSLTALAAMGLLRTKQQSAFRIADGAIYFNEVNLTNATENEWRTVRARKIAMVFQEPMTALNPIRRVCDLMEDVLRAHRRLKKSDRYKIMEECLTSMGIQDTSRVLQCFPFQLSGGMRQRVLISIALLCEPQLLIADEITTALDVTVQAQIISLLLVAAKKRGLAILLISHDLALVRHTADRVMVMLKGRIIESGAARSVIELPQHPYTKALIAALPESGEPRRPLLKYISKRQGTSLEGCAFRNRCPDASSMCAEWPMLSPSETNELHWTRCWHTQEVDN